MAGTYPETKTLDRICTIAAAQGGIGAGRMSQGFKRWSEASNLEQLARALTAYTQGYFWAALRRVPSQGQNARHDYQFAGELVVYVPKDTSNDLNSAWEFALALRDALETESSYSDGEFVPRVTVGLSRVDVVQGAGLAFFDFGGGDAGGEMTSIDP